MMSSAQRDSIVVTKPIVRRPALKLALAAGAVAFFTLCLPTQVSTTYDGSWIGNPAVAAGPGGRAEKSFSDRAGKDERGKADRGGRSRGDRDGKGGRGDHEGKGGRGDRDGRHGWHGDRDGHDHWGHDGRRHEGRGGHHGRGGWGRGDVDETPTVSEPETPRTPSAVRSEMRNNSDPLLLLSTPK
jgi:hypothetical protein